MKKRILISLGHPAHFYLFKNTITRLQLHGHEVKVIITDKDILAKLLAENNLEFEKLWVRNANENIATKGFKIIKTTNKLLSIVKAYKPDLMIGTLSQMAYVSKLTKIPFLFFGEDDIDYTFMQCYITYPFVSNMIAPIPTNVGIFNSKKIAYSGYQKLSYLHPNHFKPNPDLIPEIDINENYSIIRLVDLNAYHDINAKGINPEFLSTLINKLGKTSKIYISSEKQLPDKFKQYALPIKVQYMHHALAFASLFIGDSQSMTVEAAVLGVPALKFNDFNGKISVLNELEKNYGLTYGFGTSQSKQLLNKIDELALIPNLREEFQQRRQRMLSDKIDVTAFFVWFIENYPESANIMRKNPDYQYNFK